MTVLIALVLALSIELAVVIAYAADGAGLTFYASCSHSHGCSVTGHDCHPKRELPTSTTTKRRRRRRHINQTPVPLDEHGEPIY